MSKFIVTLKDVSLADKDAIQSWSQGIVEIDNQLKLFLVQVLEY